MSESFSRVALIGLGLVNSSLARVLRNEAPETEIVGCARSQATLDTSLGFGFVDRVTLDPAQAVEGCDLVVLGTPVGTFAALAAKIGPHLAEGAILTDVGSVKSAVFAAVGPHVPAGVHLIPGHPVAGTEHSGPEAGFAELFEGRWCILTPPPDADAEAVERIAALWRMAGMTVELMSAAHHDMVLAITSHLPHLIAYNIVGTVTDLEEETKEEVFKYAAAGFRDFTRIAASDPIMWRDIFLSNRQAVLEMLGRFDEDLTALQRAIRRGDGAYLETLFTRTRAIRRGVIEAKQV
ncbi:MAG: prephenate/arogenate dehydrogenase family protein [Alphaproteobacteria bacterium]|nr:prephenate/arogenate dehydrogenase family protein [Alphaproteobacteria bacterium]